MGTGSFSWAFAIFTTLKEIDVKRFLLISDTHGNLGEMEALVRQTQADAVIHAGDFGFYDNESVDRLQTRELRLIIAHSPFKNQYSITKRTERDRLIEIIREHNLFGDFPDYLEGKKTFSVPIYVVWGNHEDFAVVEMLRKGVKIHNLFLLDEHNFYEIGSGLILCGIGGNWIQGKKLFEEPLAGSGGKIWATLSQFGELYKKVRDHNGPLIFVSHISPGKEPLLVRLMTHFGPDLWISGHMGAPYPCLWNPFTVRDEQEEINWLSRNLSTIEISQDRISEEAQTAYDLIRKPLPPLENWYRKQWYLNLTDACDGYAVLTVANRQLALQTYAKGVNY